MRIGSEIRLRFVDCLRGSVRVEEPLDRGAGRERYRVVSYGFERYFSAWQWRLIFVLDVLVKSSLIYLSAAVATLGLIILSGFEPIVPIVLVGISISGLHFLCCYFAIRVIERFKLKHVDLHRARFPLLLFFANFLFAAILAVILSVGGEIVGAAFLSIIVTVTNLIPVLFVALIAWISNLIARPS